MANTATTSAQTHAARTAGSRPPWGARRLAPYGVTTQLSHTTVTVDPTTQVGVFRDRAGQVVEMGKHGTSSGTETSTVTNSDSAPDQGHDQDSQQD